MFVVLEIQGKQFKVAKDMTLVTPKLNIEGDSVTFDKVLLVEKGEGDIVLGAPYVSNASVQAKVVSHEVKDEKIIVFKKKRRQGYKKKQGHRQVYSKVLIEKINL